MAGHPYGGRGLDEKSECHGRRRVQVDHQMRALEVLAVMVGLAASRDEYSKGVGRWRRRVHFIFGEASRRAPGEYKQEPGNKDPGLQQGKAGSPRCEKECGAYVVAVEGRAVARPRRHKKQTKRPIKPSTQHIQFWRDGSSRPGGDP